MDPEISHRRRCVRQKIHSPVYVSTAGGSAGTLLDLSEIFNLSIRGLSFQSQAQLEIGERVSLRLDFTETGDSIETSGRVAWSDPSGRTGVRFRKMPRPSFRRLKESLFLNLIAACVQYQAAQERATPALLPEDDRPTTTALSVLRTEAQGSDSGDYAAILITLSTIRQDIEGCGARLQDALQRLVEHARVVACAAGAAIAVSNGEEMICRAAAGTSAPGPGARVGAEAGFSAECIRRARLLRCDDCDTHPLVDRHSCRVLGIRSIVAVPLLCGDLVFGLLEVFSPQPGVFGWKDEIYLRRLAEMAVASINLAVKAVGGPPTAAEFSALEANSRPVEADPLGFGIADFSGLEPNQTETGGSEPEDFSTPESETATDLASARLRNISLAAVASVGLLAALLFAPSLRRRSSVTPNSKGHLASLAASPKKKPGQARTPVEELERLRHDAAEGDSAAEFALGARYATGDDVGQDYAEAARWFSLSADHGHVTAQATLGAYYWLGRGVPQDFNKAYFWSVLAKAGGDEGSKYRIPALASHLSREEVIADQDQANEWIKQHQLASGDSNAGNSKD